MSMRPFWLDANVEGRQSSLCGGPRRKDGRMNIDLRQRDNGSSVTAFKIECESDGKTCETRVYDHKGDLVATHITNY